MLDWIADQMLHIGWAMWGQECDCGHNYWNWLARLIGEGHWDDDLNPIGAWTKAKYRIGDALVNAHNIIVMRHLMIDKRQ